MRILFTGGGTGGHLFPILELAREIKNIAEQERILDIELFYMGPDDFGVEALKDEGVVVIKIMSGKLRRYMSLQNITDTVKVLIGAWQALWNMFIVIPDVIFSKGGYGALPAVIAAIILRIPFIIHESDAVPGKVNKFSSRFAKRIGIAFTAAEEFFPKEKTALVGVPIRKRILGGDPATAKENLEISSNLQVIGFIGASQGAQKLNDAVLAVLKELTNEFEVVHQTGAKNIDDVKGEASIILEFTHKERYHPFGFLDEQGIRDFYLASDLIISRAGASSIYEIAAWSKPAILVPLRNAAQNHQRKNAYEYAAKGGAIVIEEANLTPHILLAEIKKVISNVVLLKQMREAAQKFSRIDSAELIAREILKMGMHKSIQKETGSLKV